MGGNQILGKWSQPFHQQLKWSQPLHKNIRDKHFEICVTRRTFFKNSSTKLNRFGYDS